MSLEKEKVSRRKILGMLAAASASVLAGCGGAGANTASSATTGTTSSGTNTGSAAGSGGASCVLTPELTIGPYFVDEPLNRSDITTDIDTGAPVQGTALNLSLYVKKYGSSACSALSGAVVDIWHADSAGKYSDEQSEGTLGHTYLRGYQITDENGMVQFKTIFPGWYSGRTVHIHVMIREQTGSATTYQFTTQIFFDPTQTATIMSQPPYASRGTPDTPNSRDSIYNSAMVMTLNQNSAGGYDGTMTLGVTG